MKNVAIVFATREGQTRKVAYQMCKHLQDLGLKVTVHNANDEWTGDLRSFDFLVFGGSVHAGGIERELVRFIKKHKVEIVPERAAFFLVLLSAATKDLEVREKSLVDVRRMLGRQIPISFARVEMIAGALKYSQYSLPIRWVMKRIAKKSGGDTDTSQDYEYTDWGQVETFANDVLKLTTEPVP